jgi:hypothetical protein
MGVELVEGRDLFVNGEVVYMRTTTRAEAGGCDLPPDRRRLPRPADVFRADSSLGVPGIIRRLSGRQRDAGQCGRHRGRRRQVDLPYVPDMIRFYLGEEPLLKNVPTHNVPQSRTIWPTCSIICRTWWSRRCMVGRLRHAGRPGKSTKEQIEAFPQAADRPAGPRTTTSPSRRWRCPTARPSSRRASRRAMSTCGPIVLVGERVGTWCPAA